MYTSLSNQYQRSSSKGTVNFSIVKIFFASLHVGIHSCVVRARRNGKANGSLKERAKNRPSLGVRTSTKLASFFVLVFCDKLFIEHFGILHYKHNTITMPLRVLVKRDNKKTPPDKHCKNYRYMRTIKSTVTPYI